MKRFLSVIACTFGAVLIMGASGKPPPPPPPETARQMIMMDGQGAIHYEGDGMLINVQLSEVELATLKIMGCADQQTVNATLINKLQMRINELKENFTNE